jgi:PadR family transcriptional regulator, regulatory protein PadR
MCYGKRLDRYRAMSYSTRVASYSLSYASASILLAISSGYRYGFDVMDMTGLPSGTVYPALRRLEQAGYVASKWEKDAIAQKDQRPARKYYSITRAGEMALEAAVKRYPLLEHVIPNLPPKSKG